MKFGVVSIRTLICFGVAIYFEPLLLAHGSVSGEAFDSAVLIRSITPAGGIGFCSGSLVFGRSQAPDHIKVLTAAHCLQGNNDFRVYVPKLGRWFRAERPFIHSGYSRDVSYSSYDVGTLELRMQSHSWASQLSVSSICKQSPAQAWLYRVGFGGRNQINERQVFKVKVRGVWQGPKTLVVADPESVSGDSGGPLYAVESDQTCVVAVHSTVDFGGAEMISYNPLATHALSLLK